MISFSFFRFKMETDNPDLLEFSNYTKEVKENFKGSLDDSNIENTEKNNKVKTKYMCSQCNRFCHTLANLTQHVENVHGKKDQICPICGLGFKKVYINR